MNLEQIVFVSIILIVAGALIIKNPWKDLDLTSREETDDSVKSPAHVDPVIEEAVSRVEKVRRSTKKEETRTQCELEGIDVAVSIPKVTSSTPKRRAVRKKPIL